MNLPFRDLLRISRPRFWMYTFWPALVGMVASEVWFELVKIEPRGWDERWLVAILVVVFFYFLFPANLLIYGVNDLADGDTDEHNEKKQGYEQRLDRSYERALRTQISGWTILSWLLLTALLFFLFVYHVSDGSVLLRDNRQVPLGFVSFMVTTYWQPLVALVCFWVFSIIYSAPPIRAKAVPFLDGICNVLYVLPGVSVYLFLAPGMPIVRTYVIAGRLRCMAMHAYSAIPDIVPDAAVGITTTAVCLGEKWTLRYCLVLWLLSAVLIFPAFPLVAMVGGVIYTSMISLSFMLPVFRLYRRFPLINTGIGFLLFWAIVLHG